jgi:hypothetical protein
MKIDTKNVKWYINQCKALGKMHANSQEIEKGGPYAVENAGADMYEKLRRIEAKAHRYAEMGCNGELTEDQEAKQEEAIRQSVSRVFGMKRPKKGAEDGAGLPAGFFINGDPRGYALKIKELHVREGMHKDWGGYGILAPEY